LQEIASAHAAVRSKQAVQAEAIIDHEVERFRARLQSRDVVPTIVSLQEHFEKIRQSELLRLRGVLGSLTAEQKSVVDGLTRGIVNKIVHAPMIALKASALVPDHGAAVAAVTRLFGLSSGKSALGDAIPVADGDQLAA
jgi:glutamyl-tRNA reductase